MNGLKNKKSFNSDSINYYCRTDNIINMESYKFFKKNEEKVKKIISCLEDNKSKEIYKNVIKFRCFQDLKCLQKYSFTNQYFSKNIIKLSDKEVFVDCGACIGDTAFKFLVESKNKYKKIIAFEPNFKNFNILKKWEKRITNMYCFNIALWSNKSDLYFLLRNSLTSKVVGKKISEKNKNLIVVKADKIDNIKECSDVTFLKMDIEGAELKALKGAEKTIRKNKPKLAISIYHSDRDIIDIVEWIIKLNMQYKLYVRHYSNGYRETVLYAV